VLVLGRVLLKYVPGDRRGVGVDGIGGRSLGSCCHCDEQNNRVGTTVIPVCCLGLEMLC
jgi:hypothetical protein